MKYYPMKRFPDVDPDRPEVEGIFAFDAKQYGIGAFCWKEEAGVTYIVFRHPDKVAGRAVVAQGKGVTVTRWPTTPPDTVTAIPVSGDQAWGWDGNPTKPTLSPSISVSTKRPQRDAEDNYINGAPWESLELFHGWIKAGVLEVIE